jgi:hypothetical protein
MNILFICGSIEMGKDGVGDYTRRLAGEFIRLGHKASIVAINDRFVKKLNYDPILDVYTNIPTLRIPSALNDQSKKEIAGSFIQTQNPDWVSVQFVPFSFHSRGIPFKLGGLLYPLIMNRKRHVMFHELWIGVYGSHTFKSVLLGWIQKVCIRYFLDKVQFNCVSTSNDCYLKKLSGLNAFHLPIFGNIPVSKNGSNFKKRETELHAIVFGTITSDLNQFEEQLKWLLRFAQSKSKKLKVHFIGNGGAMVSKARSLVIELIGEANFQSLGFLQDSYLSSLISQMDIGVSRADYQLFEKSGTTMSLLEHGLPVLLKGKRPVTTGRKNSSLYYEQLFFASDSLPDSLSRFQIRSGLNNTAIQFIDNLDNYSFEADPSSYSLNLNV